MSPRRNPCTDANQPAIVEAFRKLGCSVQILAAVGQGVPDLLIGFRGFNYLVEVKDGSRVPSQRKLTDDQKKWHGKWKGQVDVIEDVASVRKFLLGPKP